MTEDIHQKKILIVEDDIKMSSIYLAALASENYDIHVVYDGAQAIDTLNMLVPDLVILDLILPKVDGMAVLERIRENDALNKVPVLIISNMTSKETVNMGLAAGAQAYILKTELSIDTFIEKVKYLLNTPLN